LLFFNLPIHLAAPKASAKIVSFSSINFIRASGAFHKIAIIFRGTSFVCAIGVKVGAIGVEAHF